MWRSRGRHQAGIISAPDIIAAPINVFDHSMVRENGVADALFSLFCLVLSAFSRRSSAQPWASLKSNEATCRFRNMLLRDCGKHGTSKTRTPHNNGRLIVTLQCPPTGAEFFHPSRRVQDAGHCAGGLFVCVDSPSCIHKRANSRSMAHLAESI